MNKISFTKFPWLILICAFSVKAFAEDDLCQEFVNLFNNGTPPGMNIVSRSPTNAEYELYNQDKERCWTGLDLGEIWEEKIEQDTFRTPYFSQKMSASCSHLMIGYGKTASCGGMYGKPVEFRKNFGDNFMGIHGGDIEILKWKNQWYALVNPSLPDSLILLDENKPTIHCSFERSEVQVVERVWVNKTSSPESCVSRVVGDALVPFIQRIDVPDNKRFNSGRIFSAELTDGKNPIHVELKVREWTGGCGGHYVDAVSVTGNPPAGLTQLLEELLVQRRTMLPKRIGYFGSDSEGVLILEDAESQVHWRVAEGKERAMQCEFVFQPQIKSVTPLRTKAYLEPFSW